MIEIKFDGTGMERALMRAVGPDALGTAMARAATRVAAGARAEITRQLPSIFDRPTAFTLRSIRYEAATPESRTARVYISDDANRGLSPRKYLGPEIVGGRRNLKRSERALQMRGLMEPGQWLVPADGFPLDAHGNVSGALMTRILSRLGGMVEAGFNANASEKTKRRLAKLRMATRASGTDYFIAHSRRDGQPLGIYQLLGPGHVRPVFIFANKAPEYRARFPFEEMVEKFVRERFDQEMARAILDTIR